MQTNTRSRTAAKVLSVRTAVRAGVGPDDYDAYVNAFYAKYPACEDDPPAKCEDWAEAAYIECDKGCRGNLNCQDICWGGNWFLTDELYEKLHS